jgi:hypothetical protein
VLHSALIGGLKEGGARDARKTAGPYGRLLDAMQGRSWRWETRLTGGAGRSAAGERGKGREAGPARLLGCGEKTAGGRYTKPGIKLQVELD